MASPSPINVKKVRADNMVDAAAGSLDVSWLLQSKKGRGTNTESPKQSKATDTSSPSIYTDQTVNANAPTNGQPDPSPSESPVNGANTATAAGKANLPSPPPPVKLPNSPDPPRSNGTRPPASDENKAPPTGAKGSVSNLKNSPGRKASWFSSLSSKKSSSVSTETSRSSSVDSQVVRPQAPTSPKVEFGNPFDKKGKKDAKKTDEPIVIVPLHQPRRQSVLVHAGQERKLDNPGFLSSALRRLSSSNNATLGKGAGSGAIAQRKIMNVDPNRERVKIPDFDQNNLKRVAFCVDVEIAGYGAQAEEEHATQQNPKPATSLAGQERLSQISTGQDKIDTKEAKYKEKGEGAALRSSQAVEEKDSLVTTKKDAELKVVEKTNNDQNSEQNATVAPSEPQPIPTTKKKEKKKRSEEERKARREKKRRQAEANGLVPLELSGVHDDDSDSTPSQTPPGTSTPSIRNGDSPTTDPLRIYKRCCQLRESAVLDRVKEQILKPAATLAEAPGTVGIVDLSGLQMSLEDVSTLGDWLAVVPVRKLVLDDCNLTDEGLRVILAGLAGCKSAEQAKLNRKLPRRAVAGKRGQEQMCVIEKLSLKNNTHITNLGWKHIALFMYMSRSLRAIDLSGIPFPKRSAEYNGVLSRTTTASSTSTNNTTTLEVKYSDLGSLIAKALSERFGEKLEELILSRCGLAASNVGEIIDCAITRKICRLGIAENNLTQEGVEHVIRYVKSGVCEGLDLGGNDLHGTGHLVANAVDENNPLFAVSLVNCNLKPADLSATLSPFSKLKNFKFIDISQNHELFNDPENAVSILRRSLPKLKALKRIHINDVDLTSEHVIALAEVLPDCPELAHISILDNQPLVKAMNSKEGGAQEEACAFLASLMTAARVSKTLIAIELEVPSSDSSEVVKALASQIVAYSLRNMEYGALDDMGVGSAHVDQGAPEVLLHIVGHMEGYDENHDGDEPAPDEDYMIASTGIVKALGVCLGTKDQNSRSHSRNISPSGSGRSTPKQGPLRTGAGKKPKNVSLQLCDSARKIRMRLRPALVKEDRAGNDQQYRRLQMLDSTLERMIQRFEDEYPETKIPALGSSPLASHGGGSLSSSLADKSILSASMDSNGLRTVPSAERDLEGEAEKEAHLAVKMSRTSSNTSLAAKALASEEGRMLRLGQTFRREVLKPQGDDYQHGTSENDPPEPAHLAVLRSRLEELGGDELREKVEKDGAEKVISDMKINMKELKALQEDDPAGFEKFKESQIAAQLNAQI